MGQISTFLNNAKVSKTIELAKRFLPFFKIRTVNKLTKATVVC